MSQGFFDRDDFEKLVDLLGTSEPEDNGREGSSAEQSMDLGSEEGEIHLEVGDSVLNHQDSLILGISDLIIESGAADSIRTVNSNQVGRGDRSPSPIYDVPTIGAMAEHSQDLAELEESLTMEESPPSSPELRGTQLPSTMMSPLQLSPSVAFSSPKVRDISRAQGMSKKPPSPFLLSPALIPSEPPQGLKRRSLLSESAPSSGKSDTLAIDKLDEALFSAKRKAEQVQSSIDQLRPLAHEFAGLPPPEGLARPPEANASSIHTDQLIQNLDQYSPLVSSSTHTLPPAINAMSGDDAKVALANILSSLSLTPETLHQLRTPPSNTSPTLVHHPSGISDIRRALHLVERVDQLVWRRSRYPQVPEGVVRPPFVFSEENIQALLGRVELWERAIRAPPR